MTFKKNINIISTTISIAFIIISSTINSTQLTQIHIETTTSLLISICIALIGTIVQQVINQDELKKEINTIRNTPKIVIFKDRQSLGNDIHFKVSKARNIYNTFVKNDDTEWSVEASREYVTKMYTSWLENKNDGVWRDLISPSQLGDKRFTDIKPKNISGKHKVKSITSDVPVLNFLLIEYTDESREVFFGWIRGYGGPNNTAVLSTQNDDIVNLFEANFKQLWDASEKEHEIKYH